MWPYLLEGTLFIMWFIMRITMGLKGFRIRGPYQETIGYTSDHSNNRRGSHSFGEGDGPGHLFQNTFVVSKHERIPKFGQRKIF